MIPITKSIWCILDPLPLELAGIEDQLFSQLNIKIYDQLWGQLRSELRVQVFDQHAELTWDGLDNQLLGKRLK